VKTERFERLKQLGQEDCRRQAAGPTGARGHATRTRRCFNGGRKDTAKAGSGTCPRRLFTVFCQSLAASCGEYT
jgi:hypothetical protein